MMFPTREAAERAYRNACSFNDCHPAGGTEARWRWERALRLLLDRWDRCPK